MTISRRDALLYGALGLKSLCIRSLLTGIPTAILNYPRQALADVPAADTTFVNPQFLLLSTSDQGDPLNCNAPGMYDDTTICHPPTDAFSGATINFGGKSAMGAKTWNQLAPENLSQTCFLHHATYSGIHTEAPKILALNGAMTDRDMLISSLATKLAPALKTIQTTPVVLSYAVVSSQGQPIAPVPPSSLAAVYTAQALGSAKAAALRDETLDKLHGWLKNNGNAAQKNYVDQFVRSQQQAREIPTQFLAALQAIKDQTVPSQVKAALFMFQMRLAPAATITIPFGGDNHSDADLAREAAQYDGAVSATNTNGLTGVAAMADMFAQIKMAGLQDNVTFASLNVFGRTCGPGTQTGRQHSSNHHVMVLSGKNVEGGVVGGVKKGGGQALAMDPATGQGNASGAIPFNETLQAAGKTLSCAVGLGRDEAESLVNGGRVITAALKA